MSAYLNATKKVNKSHLPVWLMRQAGRYLPEYMAIKSKSNFHEMSHQPKLMSEITLQPLKRYPLDAAIMFSDILTCLEYMGAPFKFSDSGPKLGNSGTHVLAELTALNPKKDMMFIREGIQLIKKDLNETPLIGFVGAPFTLCSYLVEGGTSKEFHLLKKFIYGHPTDFSKAMDHIATNVGNYLLFQIESGVDAVQIFDSWVGIMSASDYEVHILPHMKKMISMVKSKSNVPVTLYSQPTTHLLPLLMQTGADVLSVDWRQSLTQTAQITERKVSLQGNLDPMVVTLPWTDAKPHVERVLEEVKQAEIFNQFIFNVGHGVTPATNTDTIKHVIDFVHNYK